MAFRIKGSHIIALAILAAIGGWMYTGEIIVGGQSDTAQQAPPIAQREATRSAELFKVRYVPIQPEARVEQIAVRGRTKADAIVTVRSEAAGIVEDRLVNKGDRVNKGDLVCVVERGTRQEQLAQAMAQLAQAEGDYNANASLAKKGFASETKVNQLKFALDAAKAAVAQAKWNLGRTEVRANASGVVQDPIVEPGDMLTVGGTCVTLIDRDPMLFMGQVSERHINNVKPGMAATVRLVTGDEIEGRIRYIAPSADAKTRTFEVEIEIANADESVRDGMTASATVNLPPVTAYRVSPSWINLADSGAVGLRAIDENDRVKFVPIKVLAMTKEGFWVSGPQPGMRVITLGQDYVGDGEQVEPVPDKIVQAEVQQ